MSDEAPGAGPCNTIVLRKISFDSSVTVHTEWRMGEGAVDLETGSGVM